MPRSRSPNRDKAKQLYLESDGDIKLKDIADQLGIKDSQVRKWKSQDKWDEERKGALPKGKGNVTNHKEQETEQNSKKVEAIAPEVEQVVNNPDLTDKQRLFCLQYVRCFNATKAYQKAYRSSYMVANAEGYKLLVNPRVKAEIQRLKQNRLNREMLSTEDIFQKYMDIAFADITDFITFGRETVPVMGAFGPVEVKDKETGKKVVLTKEINTVRFREYTDVDGTLISEVKQGKDGASIKLLDREKALRWLSDHMDMGTAEQQAKVALLTAQRDKITGNNQEIEDMDDIEGEIYEK
nr:MAG TPA: Terminase small subunit [Caudoviricetes sp.]